MLFQIFVAIVFTSKLPKARECRLLLKEAPRAELSWTRIYSYQSTSFAISHCRTTGIQPPSLTRVNPQTVQTLKDTHCNRHDTHPPRVAGVKRHEKPLVYGGHYRRIDRLTIKVFIKLLLCRS